MYDIFFLSYDESTSDASWASFKQRWPSAKRVHGVKGIAEAHKTCAKKSFTSHFFVVDADNVPDIDFPFDIKIPEYDAQYVHLWYSRNIPCELEYGWGGVKLFPRDIVRKFEGSYIDFTMTFGLKIIPEAKSTNKFNTDEFSSWRSAFREAAKLASAGDSDSLIRLEKWKSPKCGPHMEFIALGAKMGEVLASTGTIEKINDWEWLKEQFTNAKQSI